MSENTQNKIARLQGQLIETKVDLNIERDKVKRLEKQLAEARQQIREYEVGTQTARKLAILGETEENTGRDPRDTGTFNTDHWRFAR